MKNRNFLLCLTWSLGVLVVQACFVFPAFAESFQLKLGRLFAEGRTAEMEESVEARLKNNPSQAETWLELAGLRKSQGNYPGAVEAYQNFLAQKDDWKVRAGLALVWEQSGKFPAAEESFLGLLKDHPDDPEILWGLARLRLYQYKWKIKRTKGTPQEALKDAKKYLQRLTALRPEIALATWQLAEVSRLLGDRDLALSCYEKVVHQDASYKLAHRYIAKLLDQKGRVREALAKYEQAMAIEPDDNKLKLEASLAARSAPAEAQKRQAQRLQQWVKWKPKEETLIAPSSVTVRVGLFSGIGRVLFKSDSELQVMTPAQTPLTLLAGGEEYRFQFDSAKKTKNHTDLWVIKTSRGKTLLTFDRRIWITPKDPKKAILLHAVPSNTGYFFAREEDRAYRGILEMIPRPGAGFQAVNRVSLEDYLAGVLPAEMPSHWPMEAQKAQAVVARTYVMSKMGRHNADGFDVCDSVHCEVYRGLRAEYEKSNAAVRETAGLVLKHGRKLLPVVFSAQCGGHTQDFSEAWGAKLPVVGVEDYEPRFNTDMEFPLSPGRMERWIREPRVSYCRVFGLRGYQNYRWAAVITAQAVQNKSGNIGRVRRLTVTHRSTAGWADHLLVEGEFGTKELKGDNIRSFLGGIRSNLIWIEPQFNLKGWPEEFLIYGGGWGHGVGMCQVGTYGLAQAGKTWEQILEHYFPKGSVQKLDQPKTN